MKKLVDRAVPGERAITAKVAAAWPTGARIPWLPVIETGEADGDAAKKAATADQGVDPANGDSTRGPGPAGEVRRRSRETFGRRAGGTCRDLARSSA